MKKRWKTISVGLWRTYRQAGSRRGEAAGFVTQPRYASDNDVVARVQVLVPVKKKKKSNRMLSTNPEENRTLCRELFYRKEVGQQSVCNRKRKHTGRHSWYNDLPDGSPQF